jgi:dihydroneopterin aldolase
MTQPTYPDRLSLRAMRFDGRHGVLPDEKSAPQRFEVDLVLHADLSEAAERDAIGSTVDYTALHDLVRAIVTGTSFDLIEALAGAIARAVLAATDPALVGTVEVTVRKPQAPIDGDLDGPQVTLVRRRVTG